MKSNMWDRPELVAGYQRWYRAEGRRAVALETELLSGYLAAWTPLRGAVDLGCGTGHFTRWLAALGIRPVGLDRSPAMLEEAMGIEELPYVRGDLQDLPFRDDAFGVGLLVTVLEFLPDPGAALREAARVCRCGLLLGVLNRWSALAGVRRLRGGPVWSRAHFYSPRELGLLVANSLGTRVQSLDWRTALLPRPLEFLAHLVPIGGFLAARVTLAGGDH